MKLLPDKVDKLSQVFITETANCYDEHIAAEKEAKVGGEMKLLSDKYHVCLHFVQSMMVTILHRSPFQGNP